MEQRSFSPCFFGNKVTMAFKLIFVFAIIAIFAVDALDIKMCGGNYQLKGTSFKTVRGKLTEGRFQVSWGRLEPTKYVMRDSRGKIVAQQRINGCNGLKGWVREGLNCNKGGWRTVKFRGGIPPSNPTSEFKLELRGKNNRLIGCFKIDD